MISLDISLVWVIINLLVLYLLLKKFLFMEPASIDECRIK